MKHKKPTNALGFSIVFLLHVVVLGYAGMGFSQLNTWETILFSGGVFNTLLLLVLFFKYGKKHSPKLEVDFYHSPPSQLTPAEVGALMNHNRISVYLLYATLFDLVRRRVLKVRILKENGSKDYQFDFIDDHGISLFEHERFLLQWIQSNHMINERMFSVRRILNRYRGGKEEELKRFLKVWAGLVFKKTRFYFTSTQKMKLLVCTLLTLECLIAPALALFEPPVSLFSFLAATSALLLNSLFIWYISGVEKMTYEGSVQLAKWKSYQQFLSEKETTSRKDAQGVTPWENEAIYSIAFYQGHPLLKELDWLLEKNLIIDAKKM